MENQKLVIDKSLIDNTVIKLKESISLIPLNDKDYSRIIRSVSILESIINDLNKLKNE